MFSSAFRKAKIIWPFFLYPQLSFGLPTLSEEFWGQWNRLLYFYNTPLLNDSNFLYSKTNFSPEKELVLTIEAFRNGSDICKFPARYQFLEKHKLLEKPFNIDHCVDLLEYLEKVPVDSLHYVFASENLHSVTSMMGHGFLMARGQDKDDIERRHTYSFFADLAGGNPVTLIL